MQQSSIKGEFGMRVLHKQGEMVTLGFTPAEHEMLVAALDAAKYADPTIISAEPEDCESYRDLVRGAKKTTDGYELELHRTRLLKIRSIVVGFSSIGERPDYPDDVNRIFDDENVGAIDALDDSICAIYREAFPNPTR